MEQNENMVFEVEGMPTEPQMDCVYVLNGRGQLVEVEVSDDAGDD